MDTLRELSKETRDLLEVIPAGFLIFDADFLVLYSNQNLSLFGISETEIEAGKDLRFGVFRKEYSIEPEIEKMKEGVPFEKELKSQRTTDGGEISLILKGVPIFEDEFKGGILLLEDLKVISDSRKKGEDVLSSANSHILDNTLALMLILNRELEILHSNGKLSPKINIAVKKGKVLRPDSLFGDELLSVLQDGLITLQSDSRGVFYGETEYFSGSDQYYLRYNLVRVPSGKSNLEMYALVFEDITELKTTISLQLKAIEELEHYHAIAEKLEFALCMVDSRGNITHWNRGIENLLGYKKSEVFGKDFLKLTGLSSRYDASRLYEQLLEADEVQTETDFYSKLGELRKVKIIFKLLSLSEAEPQISILVSDISEEKKKNSEISSSLNSFSNFVGNFDRPVCFYDDELQVNYANTAFMEFFALPGESIKGEYLWKFFAGSNAYKNLKYAKEFFRSPVTGHEVILYKKADQDQPRRCFIDILKSESEGSNNFILSFRDMTDAILDARELAELNGIFSTADDGMALLYKGVLKLANDSFIKLFNFPSYDTVIGRELGSLIESGDKDKLFTFLGSDEQSGINQHRLTLPVRSASNDLVYVEVVANDARINDENYRVLIARDVTREKIAEERLKESEIKYRSLTENLDDFFWIAERRENAIRVLFYTSSVIKITGHDADYLLSDSKNFLKLIYPDDFGMFKSKLKRFYLNYYKGTEEIEFRIINKFGNVVWVRNKMSAVREKKGAIQKIFGLVTDVSSQKKAEQILKESTSNLQKLNETKDKFISIISHDLRTPFSSILGFTDLLISDDELTVEERKQYVGYIAESSRSMLTMVNSLLEWTRLQTGRINFEPDRVNLSELAEKSIVSLKGYAMKKKIDLINEITGEIYTFIDEGLVMQAFNNLMSNSLKFTSEGGFVKISARQSDLPRFIEVTVEDNGAGIKAENLSKIFQVDSKFTTVGTGGEKGTGLGLSLVHEIISKHGGAIRVESEYGKGAKFIFTLPKASASILLVDDNTTDKILYTKIIKGIAPDYSIITASDGKEALEMVAKHSPALIITDHIMPVMSGYVFVKTLLERNIKGKPPIIVLSGDMRKNEGLIYNDLGVEFVFSKPVNLASFKSAIESCLKKLIV
ncbi:MAG: PAS domain S-box protein [Ignavibacteriaceae bacterium]|nr:PAS domain S-box protein [Ignavibacteriaceae bacterium]